MSSPDELQGDTTIQQQVRFANGPAAEMSPRAQLEDLPRDVTVKFHRHSLKLAARKDALIAGSTYFHDHFEEHPAATTVIAPKTIVPGKAIRSKTAKIAIAYLQGEGIEDDTLLKNITPLLLIAKALGIPTLEKQLKSLLSEKLVRQFELVKTDSQVLELIAALTELYGMFGGSEAVGNEVVGVVASVVAGACESRLGFMKRVPEFDRLLRELPGLGADIIAAQKGLEEEEEDDDGGTGVNNGGLLGHQDVVMGGVGG